MIYDFVMAAWSWIAMGVGVAIAMVYITKRNDKNG